MNLEKILKKSKNFFIKAAIIGTLSLPLFFYNCGKERDFVSDNPRHPGGIIEEKSGITNSNGEVYFTDNSTLEEVTVEVIDVQNQLLPDIQVNFTDGKGYEVFWLRDLSGKYLPTLGIFGHNSKHIIKMEESDKGIYEIYTLNENSSKGDIVWEWRDKEGLGFSEYSYERTINYDEYLGIQERSNVESTFSMIKRRFGNSVRCKRERSQDNEILLKCLCHNLCVLVQELFLNKIEIDFLKCSEIYVAHK